MISFNLIQNALGFIFNKKRFAVYEEPIKGYDVEVLKGMSVLSYNVNNDSQFMEHPIESGAKIADHHVFNPIEISCKVAMPPKSSIFDYPDLNDLIFGSSETFEDTYKQLKALYDGSKRVRIKTEADVYDNMYITGLPSDVDSNTADRQIFYITFKQALVVEPQYTKLPSNKVKNGTNASYKKTGEVLPNKMSDDSSKQTKSWLKGIFS